MKGVRVYFRDLANGKKLGMMQTGPVFDTEDAILFVKEQLVASGAGFEEPVLAVVEGGKP